MKTTKKLQKCSESYNENPSRFAYFCKDQGFKEYPLNERHIFCLDTLHRKPGSDEHHDPFDQLLLAQAKSDGLVFMTHDSLIPDYEEPYSFSVIQKALKGVPYGAPVFHLSIILYGKNSSRTPAIRLK
jgi:PIN domain nuclease of toxin-antitoxin system